MVNFVTIWPLILFQVKVSKMTNSKLEMGLEHPARPPVNMGGTMAK